MQLIAKLGILADAAKYDASCASSGAPKRSSRGRDGLGATDGMGICHSYTPDGRCVSLLKVLLTNFCLYDCQYCINRRSSNVPRARFSPEEVVRLTLDFYRRNCISGLFLSSGIIRSADYTMEQLIRVARLLREEHQFRGYIHLKTIPDADPLLIEEAGRLADRLSVNIELPTEASLKRLAPEKQLTTIRQAMGIIHLGQQAVAGEARAPRFTPAGQSTQVIVGADATDDRTILRNAESLYQGYGLRRAWLRLQGGRAVEPVEQPGVGYRPQAGLGLGQSRGLSAGCESRRTGVARPHSGNRLAQPSSPVTINRPRLKPAVACCEPVCVSHRHRCRWGCGDDRAGLRRPFRHLARSGPDPVGTRYRPGRRDLAPGAGRRSAGDHRDLHSFPTRRSSDLLAGSSALPTGPGVFCARVPAALLTQLEQAARYHGEQRWNLLYEVLWRVAHGDRTAMLAGDRLGSELQRRIRQVRREAHHLHAFVRFVPLPEALAERLQLDLVAFHEPAHDIQPMTSSPAPAAISLNAWGGNAG